MTVQPRIAQVRVVNASDGAAYWDFTATAAVQDPAAGASVAVSCVIATAAGTLGAPTAPTNADLYLYDDATSTLIASFTVTPSAGTTSKTFYFTIDGTSTGAARAGTVRIKVRLRQTGGLAATQYDASSEGNTYGTGANSNGTNNLTNVQNVGWIRGTTTATTVLAGSGTLAYGDTLTATTTLGAAPYSSKTVNVTLAPLSSTASASSTTTSFTTALGTVDNRFPASSASRSTVTSFPNSTLSGSPWTSATPTETTRTIDPRLTFTHLLQLNDNAFGTPPSTKNVSTGQRLTTDLGFLSARVTNANGTGINGITWSTTLQDSGALVSALTSTPTSATQGGQAGWGNAFLTWASTLPTGTWNKTCTITAPSGATGLESGNTTSYTLVAANPNYRLVCGGGPATTATDSRHFVPGDAFLAGLVVFNTQTLQTLALDASPAPSIAIGRFNLTLGRAEYLDSDGTTWQPATGATAYYHTCTASPGDANAYTKTFTGTQTSGWGTADIFVIGRCFVGGVPVNDFTKEIVVTGKNNHTGYAFDGPGFLGFPTR